MINGNVSFWHADMGGLPAYRAALSGDTQADVCIIGAGFTGLWAAYYLHKRDPSLNIVVVEKEFAGFGASGRNGGWCSGEFAWSREKYLKHAPRQAVIDFETALRESVFEVQKICLEEEIDCDFLLTDLLTFAQSPAQMARLRAEYDEALRWQVPASRFDLLNAKEAQTQIAIANSHGALATRKVARVQPAKLVRGLAQVVERKGIRIFEKTTVRDIAKGRVTTDRGQITAGVIIRATEGFSHHVKGGARQWVPLNSALVVTEPLSAEKWREIGWQGQQLLADSAHAYCYAQRTREGRIAMGGRGVPYRFGSKTDVAGQTQAATIAQLKDILYKMLPQTRDLRLDHAWCGVLGVPRDWCATLGFDRDTGFAWAGGYVGVGVSTSNLAGRSLADLTLGLETELTRLAWVNRRPKLWEPEPLRWLGIHSMYQLYHMADRRESKSGGLRSSRLAAFANRLTGR